MEIKANNTRKPRTYRATDVHYQSALDKAKKKKTTLVSEIEKFVIRYSKSK